MKEVTSWEVRAQYRPFCDAHIMYEAGWEPFTVTSCDQGAWVWLRRKEVQEIDDPD